MLEYTDHDGFSVLMHRAEDEKHRKLVEVVISNPPKEGWSSGANVQIPEEVFADAVKSFNPHVDKVMRIVCAWYVAVNDGAGFDAGDLVHELEKAGFELPKADDAAG